MSNRTYTNDYRLEVIEVARTSGKSKAQLERGSGHTPGLIGNWEKALQQDGQKAYRFRILNTSKDRTLNLQMYHAKSSAPMWNSDGTLNDANAGEVPMVAAVQNGQGTNGWVYPDELDGRDASVPDSSAAGTSMIPRTTPAHNMEVREPRRYLASRLPFRFTSPRRRKHSNLVL